MSGGGEITCKLLWMRQMLGEAHICCVGRSAFTKCGNYNIWIYTNFMVKHFYGWIFTTWWPQKNKSNAKIQICKNPDCRWACSWKLSWKTFRTCAHPVGKKIVTSIETFSMCTIDLLKLLPRFQIQQHMKVSDPATYQLMSKKERKKTRWSNNPWKQKKKKTTQQFSILVGSHPHVHYWPPNSKHVVIANNYHDINKTSTVQWLCLLLPVSWYCVKVNVVCYPTRAPALLRTTICTTNLHIFYVN